LGAWYPHASAIAEYEDIGREQGSNRVEETGGAKVLPGIEASLEQKDDQEHNGQCEVRRSRRVSQRFPVRGQLEELSSVAKKRRSPSNEADDGRNEEDWTETPKEVLENLLCVSLGRRGKGILTVLLDFASDLGRI
jgi:hypothetical protein